MGEKILRRLPLAYATLAPLAWLVALRLAEGPTLDPLRVAIYFAYFASASAIACGLVYLVLRSEDSRASAWLVSVMYEAVFFALSLMGVFSLTVLRLYHPELSASPFA